MQDMEAKTLTQKDMVKLGCELCAPLRRQLDQENALGQTIETDQHKVQEVRQAKPPLKSFFFHEKSPHAATPDAHCEPWLFCLACGLGVQESIC